MKPENLKCPQCENGLHIVPCKIGVWPDEEIWPEYGKIKGSAHLEDSFACVYCGLVFDIPPPEGWIEAAIKYKDGTMRSPTFPMVDIAEFASQVGWTVMERNRKARLYEKFGLKPPRGLKVEDGRLSHSDREFLKSIRISWEEDK
jgi:hypothetical protein